MKFKNLALLILTSCSLTVHAAKKEIFNNYSQYIQNKEYSKLSVTEECMLWYLYEVDARTFCPNKITNETKQLAQCLLHNTPCSDTKKTPLELAVETRNSNLLENILSLSSVEITKIRAFSEMIRSGNTEEIVRINQADFKMSDLILEDLTNQPLDKFGNTALHLAVMSQNTELINILKRFNVDIYRKNINDKTPLHLAAEQEDPQVIKALYTKKEHIKEVNCLSRSSILETSIIHTSAQNTIIDSLEINEFDLNSQARGTGDTPLHTACKNRNTLVIESLLERGANPTIQNLEKQTPIELCAELGYKDGLAHFLMSPHVGVSLRKKAINVAANEYIKNFIAQTLE